MIRPTRPLVHRRADGFTIVAERMPVEAVCFDLWTGVGSRVEPDPINGVAHFLEHMIFKGSASLRPGEFEQRVEACGAITNAATSQDYTHYFFTSAPTDFADLVPLQLEVALQPALPEAEFERERRVVLEEIRRADDNPQRRAYQWMVEQLLDDLPYRRPVLGPSEAIARLELAWMQDFHRHWYRPEHLTAVVVGNLPEEQMIATVERHLPIWDAGSTSTLPSLTPEEPLAAIRRQHQQDPTLQEARLYLSWRVPGLDRLEETDSLDVLASVLGSGRSSRLVQELREDRGWVTGISASNSVFAAQGLFTIAVRLPVEHLEAVETVILEHLRRLQESPVRPEELERVRTQVANRFIFGNERPADRASLYGYYQALLGDLEPAFEYPERVRSLSPEQVRQAAARYLPTDAYAALVITP